MNHPDDMAITGRTSAFGFLQKLMRKAIFNRLAGIHHGKLTVIDSLGSTQFGYQSCDIPNVEIEVLDGNFYMDIAISGSVGAGESYILGYWRCNNMVDLIRLMLRNRHVLDEMDSAVVTWFKNWINRFLHLFNRNTLAGSRRNIAAHYDLGNDFFSLFLDESMMYSAAIFPHPRATLKEAARVKLDRICQKLQLNPGDHVLEIGSGWGGFAIHAAKHYGCRVTTTTISGEQYELTCKKVRQADLHDRITVLKKDYRDLDGQFDKLVSIEMIEAIGHEYLDNYFAHCSSLLKDNGQMLLQAITIADQRYEQARQDVDFIKKYIFPGGFLPSIAAMSDAIARVTDTRIFHLEDIGPHYALTLNQWRHGFIQKQKEVLLQGFGQDFIRMWDFYLCYCEGAFLEHVIGTVQLLLIKPACRREALLFFNADSKSRVMNYELTPDQYFITNRPPEHGQSNTIPSGVRN
jgi:cyclopropane-fatty-acyl-phospholipid synthase